MRRAAASTVIVCAVAGCGSAHQAASTPSTRARAPAPAAPAPPPRPRAVTVGKSIRDTGLHARIFVEKMVRDTCAGIPGRTREAHLELRVRITNSGRFDTGVDESSVSINDPHGSASPQSSPAAAVAERRQADCRGRTPTPRFRPRLRTCPRKGSCEGWVEFVVSPEIAPRPNLSYKREKTDVYCQLPCPAVPGLPSDLADVPTRLPAITRRIALPRASGG